MEITLYNKSGKAAAYLADEDETIYLWDGRPTAYVHQDTVYGINGKQLGWFDNGTIFDIYGLRAGFIRSKSPVVTEAEPVKPRKQSAGLKAIRQPAVVKPNMCYGFSGYSLEALLEEGVR
jgi:hypothetical protein